MDKLELLACPDGASKRGRHDKEAAFDDEAIAVTNDMLKAVFTWLDGATRLVVASVCKQWNETSKLHAVTPLCIENQRDLKRILSGAPYNALTFVILDVRHSKLTEQMAEFAKCFQCLDRLEIHCVHIIYKHLQPLYALSVTQVIIHGYMRGSDYIDLLSNMTNLRVFRCTGILNPVVPSQYVRTLSKYLEDLDLLMPVTPYKRLGDDCAPRRLRLGRLAMHCCGSDSPDSCYRNMETLIIDADIRFFGQVDKLVNKCGDRLRQVYILSIINDPHDFPPNSPISPRWKQLTSFEIFARRSFYSELCNPSIVQRLSIQNHSGDEISSLQTFHKLRYLTVTNNDIWDGHNLLQCLLMACRGLESLSFCLTTNELFNGITEPFTSLKNLRLDVQNYTYELSNIATVFPELRFLDLRFRTVSYDTLKAVFTECTKLRVLHVRVSTSALAHIIEMFSADQSIAPSLRLLRIWGDEVPSAMPPLPDKFVLRPNLCTLTSELPEPCESLEYYY